MKSHHHIWYILTLAFFSCQDSNKLNLPAPLTKIVINGLLVANESPKVYVGKTWAVTDFTPAQTYYENAQVQLWENDILIGILTLKNGFYESAKVLIKPKKSYIIRVEVPNVGKAESKPVVIPPDIETMQIVLNPNIKWVTREILIRKPVLIQLFIKKPANSSDYLVTSALGFKDENKIIFSNLTTENVEISSSSLDFNGSNCYSLFPELSGIEYKRSIGYNIACFTGQTKEIGLVIDKIGQLGINSVEANFVRVYVAVYAAEYLQYAKAAQAIEGADNAFIETKPTYSNIIGGIGFVTAVNKKDTTLRL